MTEYGLRKLFVLFAVFVVLGQFVFSLGCENYSMTTMLIGRFIFGLGSECIRITQNVLIVKWVYKSEIGFSLGLFNCIDRFASLVNYMLSPHLLVMVKKLYKISFSFF